MGMKKFDIMSSPIMMKLEKSNVILCERQSFLQLIDVILVRPKQLKNMTARLYKRTVEVYKQHKDLKYRDEVKTISENLCIATDTRLNFMTDRITTDQKVFDFNLHTNDFDQKSRIYIDDAFCRWKEDSWNGNKQMEPGAVLIFTDVLVLQGG